MRQIIHSKTDWVDMKWTHGVLTHTIQKDGCSCGVYVMQVTIQLYVALEQHTFLHNLSSAIFIFIILLCLIKFSILFNNIYVNKQMAKETVEAFPLTPSEIVIPSNKRLLSELRKEMAVTILESSGMCCKHTINDNLALILHCTCTDYTMFL